MDRRPFGHLREVVNLTPLDYTLLLVMVALLVAIRFGEQIGIHPAFFAFWGAVAFTLVVLNILNRLVGEVGRLRERIRTLENAVERLQDELERERRYRGLADLTRRDN